MAQDKDDKIEGVLAEAFWVMLRMGIAGSGRRGAEIAKAAKVPESSLRKMAAKGMVPTVGQYTDILKALKSRGVTVDTEELTVKLDAVPKYRPTKDKPKTPKTTKN